MLPLDSDGMSDADQSEIVATNLQQLFPDYPEAVTWLHDVWQVMQFWDDLYDEGVSKADPRSSQMMRKVLVEMPKNTFFIRNAHTLTTLIDTCQLAWQAANQIEAGSDENELYKAYVLRAMYNQLVLHCLSLAYSNEVATEHAQHVWFMYSETFADFKAEILQR